MQGDGREATMLIYLAGPVDEGCQRPSHAAYPRATAEVGVRFAKDGNRPFLGILEGDARSKP